jgi:hypothetical protein
MTEDELVETMARAMFDAEMVACEWGERQRDRMVAIHWAEHQDRWRQDARAAFTAIRAAGYVPVPVEPTGEMIGVGRDTSRTDNVRDHSIEGRIRRIYADMLSVSPLAKKEGGE